MGACNFVGSVLGGVAVGIDRSFWTDEDRDNYREMMGDDDLSNDDIDEMLTEDEADHISDLYGVAERFISDLNGFVFVNFFSPYIDGESPVTVRLKRGYHSGFEMTVKDSYGFYRDYVRFIEAQATNWAEYYSDSKDFTPPEWADHVEKAMYFIDYALVRFAWAKGLSFVSGGWTGGTSPLDNDDVRAFAQFEKYGSQLAVLWWDFCQKYGKEYNQFGL